MINTPPHAQSTRFAMYNTTRQWNPGDEFIRFGVENIIRDAFGPVNPVIYNRNPDIRPYNGTTKGYRTEKRPHDAKGKYDLREALLRTGFFDNSIKFDTDGSFLDFAVVAGSPEYAGPRDWNFYEHIIKNSLPLVVLGAGSIPDAPAPFVAEALSKAKVFTVRDEAMLSKPLAADWNAKYMPCPALLSADSSKEKQVCAVKKIALVLGAPYGKSVVWNCISSDFFERVLPLYREMTRRYDCTFVAFYIDEIALLHRLFPDTEILYSYNAQDYFDIFRRFDFVVSTRVHGCGIASSIGIPSIGIGHDFRAGTVKGFLAAQFDRNKSDAEFFALLESEITGAPEKSARILEHKHSVAKSYQDMLQDVDIGGRVHYGQHVEYADTSAEELFPREDIVGKMLSHIDSLDASWRDYARRYPRWAMHLLCAFVPEKKNRHNIMEKYARRKSK